MKMKFYKLSIILIMVFATLGCTTANTGAPIGDFYEPNYDYNRDTARAARAVSVGHYQGVAGYASYQSAPSDYHVVSRGENIYRIAENYGLDYRSLAAVNGINSRYEIYPGQQLLLSGVEPKRAWKQKPAIYVPPPVRSKPREPIYTHVPSGGSNYPISMASASYLGSSSIKRTPTVHERTSRYSLDTPGSWSWPTSGRLVRDYRGSGSLHKGIDLRGNLGEPVRAAAAGRVVYAGDGLRSYGNLVIVKHDDKFLSAYAHNRRVLVTEGVTVARGQQIAEMGSSGTDSVKLHFEIRYDGNPVDPLQYLPRR